MEKLVDLNNRFLMVENSIKKLIFDGGVDFGGKGVVSNKWLDNISKKFLKKVFYVKNKKELIEFINGYEENWWERYRNEIDNYLKRLEDDKSDDMKLLKEEGWSEKKIVYRMKNCDYVRDMIDVLMMEQFKRKENIRI